MTLQCRSSNRYACSLFNDILKVLTDEDLSEYFSQLLKSWMVLDKNEFALDTG